MSPADDFSKRVISHSPDNQTFLSPGPGSIIPFKMSTITTTTTTTTTAAAAAASSSCHAKLYEIPTTDAACAMPMNSTYHTLMTNCCGAASVISYSDCDYYCLAQNQTIGNLAECLIKGSAAGQVWCNTNENATATGTASATGSATGNEKLDPIGSNGVMTSSLATMDVLMLVLVAFGGIAQPFV